MCVRACVRARASMADLSVLPAQRLNPLNEVLNTVVVLQYFIELLQPC